MTSPMTGHSNRPVLDVRGLTKVYGTGEATVHALRGITLTVQRGDYVAIMGSSGSGKSTLMNILGALDVPTAGRYLLDGVDVSRLADRQLALARNRLIGFIFQAFNLIPRTTAVANVELPLAYAGVKPRERRRRAMEALDTVGWSPSRRCCSPTSPPATWTATPRPTCWRCSTSSAPPAGRSC